MLEEAKKELYRNKHLLIIGKSETDRRLFINNLIEGVHREVVRTPRGITTLDDYADFIKKVKMYNPDYKTAGYPPFPALQLVYSHHDILRKEDNSCLMIIDELDQINPKEVGYVERTIKILIERLDDLKKGEKSIQLIVSQENENDLIDKLAKRDNVYGSNRNARRTYKQIVEQNLKIIDISGY
ncbi:hypothetical protein ATO12_16005 [Aquimarina atlantica]|uniref:ATPase AAA-type core domain-containing protein n=1 Tax=Aquimarina atlantica TaxID=1317122 RepID=A0A023BUF7_9FLAO|nr:AAA family ATPase [Aquimarina atlantica]EZH73443.1 hypothetical protein ATO12_16005 [Aquimarina atlantica]